VPNLVVGVHVAAPTAAATVEGIVAAEEAGIDCAWLTSGGVRPDPFAVFAAAAGRTSHIRFGTSIVPILPRHPLAMAQGAIAVDSLAPGRLRLGIGPSHRPGMVDDFGLPFERPLEYLREYVHVLRELFATGKVSHEGPRITARGQAAGPAAVEVLASALRPNAFRLCGEITDGAISWVCPLPYLRDVALPALREGAAAAGRDAPPLIAHVPVAVSEDKEAVRAAASRQLSIYPRLPFYSRMFQDAGFPEAAEGQMSERMVDALVVHGSAEPVKERLRELPSFGAAELLAMPIVPPGDSATLPRTLAALGELAQER
jgi:F420-dependent oxidoreductase-like protein